MLITRLKQLHNNIINIAIVINPLQLYQYRYYSANNDNTFHRSRDRRNNNTTNVPKHQTRPPKLNSSAESTPPTHYKRKCAFYVCYNGRNYSGLQAQYINITKEQQNQPDPQQQQQQQSESTNNITDQQSIRTLLPGSYIESTIESALYKCGLISETNYGDLNKISISRSSRTDKGVHSSGGLLLSLKLELPAEYELLWRYLQSYYYPESQSNPSPKMEINQLINNNNIDINTAQSTVIQWNEYIINRINSYLPTDIRLAHFRRCGKSFTARDECNVRKYIYYAPVAAIKLNNNSNTESINFELLNSITSRFIGSHNFHNFTAMGKLNQKQKQTEKRAQKQKQQQQQQQTSAVDSGSDRVIDDYDNKELDENELAEIESEYESESETVSDSSNPILDTNTIDPDTLYQQYYDARIKELDRHRSIRLSTSQRNILEFTAESININNIEFIKFTIIGQSFVYHQIRKMIATTLSCYLGTIEPNNKLYWTTDLLDIALKSPFKLSTPLAPPNGLILDYYNNMFNFNRLSKRIQKENKTVNHSLESTISPLLTNISHYFDSPYVELINPIIDNIESFNSFKSKILLPQIAEEVINTDLIRDWHYNLTQSIPAEIQSLLSINISPARLALNNANNEWILSKQRRDELFNNRKAELALSGSAAAAGENNNRNRDWDRNRNRNSNSNRNQDRRF